MIEGVEEMDCDWLLSCPSSPPLLDFCNSNFNLIPLSPLPSPPPLSPPWDFSDNLSASSREEFLNFVSVIVVHLDWNRTVTKFHLHDLLNDIHNHVQKGPAKGHAILLLSDSHKRGSLIVTLNHRLPAKFVESSISDNMNISFLTELMDVLSEYCNVNASVSPDTVIVVQQAPVLYQTYSLSLNYTPNRLYIQGVNIVSSLIVKGSSIRHLDLVSIEGLLDVDAIEWDDVTQVCELEINIEHSSEKFVHSHRGLEEFLPSCSPWSHKRLGTGLENLVTLCVQYDSVFTNWQILLAMRTAKHVSLSTKDEDGAVRTLTLETYKYVLGLDSKGKYGGYEDGTMIRYRRKLSVGMKSHRHPISFITKIMLDLLLPELIDFFVDTLTHKEAQEVVFYVRSNFALTIAQVVLALCSADASVSQPYKVVELAPVFCQTDLLFLNHSQKKVVDQDVVTHASVEAGTIAICDQQAQQSKMQLDAIEGNGGCYGGMMIEHRREVFDNMKSSQQNISFPYNQSEKFIFSHTTQHDIPQVLRIGNELNMCIQNSTLSIAPTEVLKSAKSQIDTQLSTKHVKAVEQSPVFYQTDNLPLNLPQKGLVGQDMPSESVNSTDEKGAIANLDPQAQQIVLELDLLERDGDCEGKVMIEHGMELFANKISRKRHCDGRMMIDHRRKLNINKKSDDHYFSFTNNLSERAVSGRTTQIENEPLSIGSIEVMHSAEFPLNALVTTEPESAMQVPRFGCTDTLSLNQPAEVLVMQDVASLNLKEVCKHSAIAKPDSRARESILNLDEIEGDSGCEGQGISTVIQNKRKILLSNTKESAISLEDLQQHSSMSLQEATKSFDVFNGSMIKPSDCGWTSSTVEEKKKRRNVTSKRVITGTLISLEDLQQRCFMTQEKAAESLGVSKSTVKRTCRQYGISNWAHLKRRKKYESLSQPNSLNIITEQGNIAAGSSQISAIANSDLHSMNPVLEGRSVTIKVEYEDTTIRFDLPYLSDMAELEEQVTKRLKVEVGSFKIEYVDEDGDRILLTSSEDLRYCIHTLTSLGKPTIRMLVKSITS